jgi:hypothetical protein
VRAIERWSTWTDVRLSELGVGTEIEISLYKQEEYSRPIEPVIGIEVSKGGRQ